jgi:uncharacterized delta-60 repeat protein
LDPCSFSRFVSLTTIENKLEIKGEIKMFAKNFKINILSAAFSLFVIFPLFTYSQFTQWVQRYNGPGNANDYANAIAVDASGNVHITGSSYGTGGDKEDYATIKYNSQSVLLWSVRHNGAGGDHDEAVDITVDGSGNVYVTGYCSEPTGDNYITIKYNSAGVQQWYKRYTGSYGGADWARSIAVWAGNVYVTGKSQSSSTNYDYVTIKYNSAGVEQWIQRYDAPGNSYDDATSIAVDGSGNVYVTGGSVGSGTGLDYATIKYNSAGVQEWIKRYNGPGNDYDRANSMAVDGAGNVYVTGESWGGATGYDYATIKYNSTGVQQWAIRYNGPAGNFDQALSIAVDGVGNVFVTGASQGSGTFRDYATVKYSSLGFQQWASRYNGPGNSDDNATSIAVDGSGYLYVTGSSGGSGTSMDYATIKYNNVGGIQQWAARYNGPGNGQDYATSLVLDGSGSIYVTGYSQGSGSGFDYATVKYSQPVGIEGNNSEIPDKFSLEQNYPNPFNPSTTIGFSLKSEGNVSIKVYDIQGKEVANPVEEKLTAGIYEFKFDASKLSSGTYFYKMVTSDFTDIKKMVIVK